MAWHILKKDLQLLWVFAVVVGAVHLAATAVRVWMGPSVEPRSLLVISLLLSLLSLLSIIFLTLSVMHQDPVPGVRQDWLIRPISRVDLIIAKLLFVLLVIHGPLFVLDLEEARVDGFSFSGSLGAATAHNAAILCYLTLPAVMIGAVTRNLTESFVVVVVGLVAYAAVFLLGVALLLGTKASVGASGLSWMIEATWFILAVAGTAIVITWQFLRRETAIARAFIGVSGAVVILSAFIPWRTAFALQEKLAKEPASAAPIALAFNQQMGAFRLPPGAAAAANTGLYVPLRVTGVPRGAVVLLDRADIRVSDASGRTLYQGRSYLNTDGGVGSIQDAQLEVRQSERDSAATEVYQRIFIPEAAYAKLRGRQVSLEVDYSLSLFREQSTFSLPASGAHGQIEGLGWCLTGVDGDGDDVYLRCLSTRQAPSCFTAFLEHTPSGLRNPEAHACVGDYSFFETKLWPPGALSLFGGKAPFFDRSGLTHYPVDGSKLADSRLVIETYEPRDHFTRHLNIPAIELADFAAKPGPEDPAGTRTREIPKCNPS